MFPTLTQLPTNIYCVNSLYAFIVFKISRVKVGNIGPQGAWVSGENNYLFSWSWGALIITLGELGSKLIVFGIKGALLKSKN